MIQKYVMVIKSLCHLPHLLAADASNTLFAQAARPNWFVSIVRQKWLFYSSRGERRGRAPHMDQGWHELVDFFAVDGCNFLYCYIF